MVHEALSKLAWQGSVVCLMAPVFAQLDHMVEQRQD